LFHPFLLFLLAACRLFTVFFLPAAELHQLLCCLDIRLCHAFLQSHRHLLGGPRVKS
ncbi:unnamed protein product, partial [Musa hybrid cultivar]